MIFFNLNILVRLLSSGYDVVRYSQDRIAKKKARMSNQVTAISQGDDDHSNILLRTDAGRAFCFTLALS